MADTTANTAARPPALNVMWGCLAGIVIGLLIAAAVGYAIYTSLMQDLSPVTQ